MKIEPTGPSGIGPIEPARQPAIEPAAPTATPPPDRLVLSERAQEVQIAREALAAVPAIRSEQVDRIRRLIAENAYEVDSSALAQDVLKHLRAPRS